MMSEVENTDALKQQINNLGLQLKGVTAQLNSTKQMMSDLIEQGINLRANIIFYQEMNEGLTNEKKAKDLEIEALKLKLVELEKSKQEPEQEQA
jgi:hypothetical protein